MRGVDVCRDGGIQELPQWRFVRGHKLSRVPSPGNASKARRRHSTPPQDIRQHGGALHALDDQRDDGCKFVLTERVAEGAGPENVVNGRVSVLVVSQVQVGHGERGQLEGAQGVSSVLHVPGDSEQLRVGHPCGRGVDNNLIGCFKGNVVLLAQRQSGQGTVLGVLHGTLQGQRPGTAGQLLPLGVVQAQAQDGVVGHDGGGHDAGGFRWGEEGVPALEDAHQSPHACGGETPRSVTMT